MLLFPHPLLLLECGYGGVSEVFGWTLGVGKKKPPPGTASRLDDVVAVVVVSDQMSGGPEGTGVWEGGGGYGCCWGAGV